MSWRLGIKHETGYRYQSDVTSSYNEARMSPLTTDRQLVVQSHVRVEPNVRTYRYWDYWGTIVDAFDIHLPHRELVITGDSVVETSEAKPLPDPIEWSDLAAEKVKDEFGEFLSPTDYVPLTDEVRDEVRAAGNPVDACVAAGEWVRSQLRYEQGATTVSSSAADALAEGRGVCQDFAHVTLARLRSAGIPGRYVSGYLYPGDEQGLGTVLGQSHAWIEAWIGEWCAFDPTSGAEPGERHVVVARGRDYADVAPLKGIYHGGQAADMHVMVELSRLA